MRRYFDWLIKHEKLLIGVNVLLIVLLVIQLRVCKSRIDPSTPVSQTPGTSSTDSIKQAPGGFEKPADSVKRIEGRWDMNVQKRRGGTQTWTLQLDQHGQDLTGVINSEGGDLPVTGTIKGQAISLSAKRFGMTIEFTAVLNGDTMKGEFRALTINRSWTAKRRT